MKLVQDSARARFLTQMLDAFDSGDFLKMMDVANHWRDTFWPFRWGISGNEELSANDRETLGEMARDLKRLVGRGLSAEKLSVAPTWQSEDIKRVWQKCFDGLSLEAKQSLGSVLDVIGLGQLESLDSRYSHEVLEILRKIIVRVVALDKLPPLTIPNLSVQLACEEAHRCYLYGFRIACAALCRATVESSLKEALEKVGHRYSTEFNDLLQLPAAKEMLGNLWSFADEVRRAGNDAVHDATKFDRRYSSDKVQELLLKTRRIVEHLYALPAA